MKNLRIITFSLIIFATIAGFSSNMGYGKRDFSIEVLDVGQGDSILIRTKNDLRFLVDGGPGRSVLGELGRVFPYLDKRIDVVLLTHPDADHLEGLIPVLEEYKIGVFLWSGTPKDSATFEKLQNILHEKNIKVETVLTGDLIKTSDDFLANILWPYELGTSEKSNESSVVFQGKSGGYSFLLTGDIGESTESKIVSIIDGEYLRSTVLKVPHHGSRFSSSIYFLGAVKPKVSVISVSSTNSYGHPTKDTLDRLLEIGSNILRTDSDGAIKFTVNDRGLVVTTIK